MLLYISTAHESLLTVAIGDEHRVIAQRTVKAPRRQSDKLLPAIDALLRKAGKTLADIKGIAIVAGPGPFTATRIGVTTANTLGFALCVPLVSLAVSSQRPLATQLAQADRRLAQKKLPSVISPRYARAPHITQPKLKKL